MPTIYLETTIPSYLAARPSRDLIVVAHQQITREWWSVARERFDLYISEAVFTEINAGDPVVTTRRLAIIDGLPILELNEDIRYLVQVYSGRLGLTGRARADLLHIAFAVSYRMDYLLTWNCAHIANRSVIRRLLHINSELGRHTPGIVTPEEIPEQPGGES